MLIVSDHRVGNELANGLIWSGHVYLGRLCSRFLVGCGGYLFPLCTWMSKIWLAGTSGDSRATWMNSDNGWFWRRSQWLLGQWWTELCCCNPLRTSGCRGTSIGSACCQCWFLGFLSHDVGCEQSPCPACIQQDGRDEWLACALVCIDTCQSRQIWWSVHCCSSEGDTT